MEIPKGLSCNGCPQLGKCGLKSNAIGSFPCYLALNNRYVWVLNSVCGVVPTHEQLNYHSPRDAIASSVMSLQPVLKALEYVDVHPDQPPLTEVPTPQQVDEPTTPAPLPETKVRVIAYSYLTEGLLSRLPSEVQ